MSEAVRERRAEGVEVSVSGEAYEILEQVAKEKDKSIVEVLEEAIGMERWKLLIKEEGGRVIIERRDGRKSELILD